jgi:hypothetical protein
MPATPPRPAAGASDSGLPLPTSSADDALQGNGAREGDGAGLPVGLSFLVEDLPSPSPFLDDSLGRFIASQPPGVGGLDLQLSEAGSPSPAPHPSASRMQPSPGSGARWKGPQPDAAPLAGSKPDIAPLMDSGLRWTTPSGFPSPVPALATQFSEFPQSPQESWPGAQSSPYGPARGQADAPLHHRLPYDTSFHASPQESTRPGVHAHLGPSASPAQPWKSIQGEFPRPGLPLPSGYPALPKTDLVLSVDMSSTSNS